MAEHFEYSRAWTDAKAFPLLGFTRNWENPEDYPTIELDEAKVRADMQSLHDEVKDYINDQLIPAVLSEDATEEARAAAETDRANAEAERQSAEEARASAEATRQSNEETRESNEASRVSAENARVNAESAREQAENGRATAEQNRAEAESLRASAEQERDESESSRVSAELNRRRDYKLWSGDEASRKTAEQNRVAAEQERASAETARDTAEQAREAAETARADENTGIVARATEQANIASSAATSAGNSAAAASNSESAAAESKNAAAGSAAAASASEANAKASETAAKASEEAAKASETAAKESETTAKSEADRAKREADRAVGIVGGDYATNADLAKKQDKFVPITIPKGRMRGDVDGDGVVTYEDNTLIMEADAENATLDEVGKWCAKVRGNSSYDISDALEIQYYVSGKVSQLTQTPTFADYYNNWSYVKVDDLTGYWTTDVAVYGIAASNSVLIFIDPNYTEDIFTNAVCGDGYVRIYASRCPIVEVSCVMQFNEGNVTGIVIPSPYRTHASRHSSNGNDPIAPESIGAAVDGDATNIDEHNANGIFGISTSCEGVFPDNISSKMGVLIHKMVSETYKEQLYMNRVTKKAYRRTYSGSAGWGDWKEIYDAGNKPTQADIGAMMSAESISGYDATKTQTLKHINGVLTWVSD